MNKYYTYTVLNYARCIALDEYFIYGYTVLLYLSTWNLWFNFFKEFYDEIFTILGMLSANHITPTMWQVLPALYELYIKALESDDIYLEGLLL